jgi:hypothetical protein
MITGPGGANDLRDQTGAYLSQNKIAFAGGTSVVDGVLRTTL